MAEDAWLTVPVRVNRVEGVDIETTSDSGAGYGYKRYGYGYGYGKLDTKRTEILMIPQGSDG